MKLPLLTAAALAIAATALAQSGPATNRPAPPAPPRPDAPGAPVNPRQNSAGNAAQDPGTPGAPATEAAPLRALDFNEADTDKDGRISLHEYTTHVENRMATRSTETVREETIQRFLDLDQNNDAFLSEAEANRPEPVQATPPPPRRR